MNAYSEFNVVCGECAECERFWAPNGIVGDCKALRDAIRDEYGIKPRDLNVDLEQDAGRCDMFVPTYECLERIREDARPLAEKYGLVPNTGVVKGVKGGI